MLNHLLKVLNIPQGQRLGVTCKMSTIPVHNNYLGTLIKFSLNKFYSLESQYLISEFKINLGICYSNSGELMPIL